MKKSLFFGRPDGGRIVAVLAAALVLAVFTTAAHASQDALAAISGSTASSKKDDDPDQQIVQAVGAIVEAIGDRKAGSPTAAMALLADVTLADGPEERDLPSMDGAKGVALRGHVDTSLSRILEYAYNADVPSYLVLPSVVRLSNWYPGSDILDLETPLYEQLPAPAEPLVLRGREYEEITPDVNSGGYYRYDVNRMLALFQHEGRNVLISAARQDGESEVGKKGVVVDDDKWNYFYSGEDGLTTGGIGWMDTYMYDSWSVSVFVEQPDGTTTNMVFKWLRAGWAGLNVVQESHILKGCKRFSRAFRSVIESDLLPAAGELAAKARELWALSEQELDSRIRRYAARVEQLWKDNPTLSKRTFASILKGGGYAEALDREQRISTLMLEYLKSQLLAPSFGQG